ncbi:hypothetical protein L1887_10685 [Cichorium endivia]|nr:hypothetical protein L1887_10685 [Cichorium endivia]
MMAGLSRELVFLILQFLEEENYKETAHRLESESGFFCNVKYVEELVTNGDWEELEKYLSPFVHVDDNRFSVKILFEIRKQKYLEALDKKDRVKALEILNKDLKVFKTLNEDLFKEMTLLLTMGDFRENQQLSKYTDTKTARAVLVTELKKLIESNPHLQDKCQFPAFKNSRLRLLINQSLNWQHQLCKNPKSNPEISTLFIDHVCGQQPNAAQGSTAVTNNLRAGGQGIVNPSSLTHGGSLLLAAETENILRRARPFGISEEGNNLATSSATRPGQRHVYSLRHHDDLPKTVISTINQGSDVNTMDFHPEYPTLLLVGTKTGDISIWEVASRLRIARRSFTASLANNIPVTANRVTWSPDGLLLGVAYSKNIVHVYSYRAGDELRDHLEIEAHVGNVNDLAFTIRNQKLSLITCGDDKTIKVWDAATGAKQHTFEGHDAPVYSVCPHHKGHIQFIFSTSIDGKIKAWLYDDMGSRLDYNAPGYTCTRMAYCKDGLRLFSCGSSKDRESYLVEWNESEGTVKRTYLGLEKQFTGVVQFDTTKKLLAAGDGFSIKFWDMDSKHLLTTTSAEGGLPASPCLRFSKDGILLAVSTCENGIKILGNSEGVRIIRSIEVHRKLPGVRSRNPDDVEVSGVWKPKEITEPSQLRSMKLPDNLLSVRILRLMYANSGTSILALAYNAVHKLWKWQRTDQNTDANATTSAPPDLWQPSSGILMTNDIRDANLEDTIPCLALSRNSSYVLSASGGKVSLFNLATFKTMTTFARPPPAATCLLFHPQDNNIIAIGMSDASIHIYNVRVDKILKKLIGHQKSVTGLAFSLDKGILVSSGSDVQLCVWNTDTWEELAKKFLQQRTTNPQSETRVQFNPNQTRLLVIHVTQISIYDPLKLDCLMQWSPHQGSGSITDAVYSCDGKSIFVSIEDGSVSVLNAKYLRLKCQISRTSYIPSNSRVCPNAIAAHPFDPNQVALGLSDGGVYVIEPLESCKKWGTDPKISFGHSTGVGSSQP